MVGVKRQDVYNAVTGDRQTEQQIRGAVARMRGRREFEVSSECVRDNLKGLVGEGKLMCKRRESDLVVEYWRT